VRKLLAERNLLHARRSSNLAQKSNISAPVDTPAVNRAAG
jgi:hypothetical protein